MSAEYKVAKEDIFLNGLKMANKGDLVATEIAERYDWDLVGEDTKTGHRLRDTEPVRKPSDPGTVIPSQ